MTGKEDYEARRKMDTVNRMRDNQAYEARLKRDELADEVVALLLASAKAFLEGRASFEIRTGLTGTNVYFRNY